MLCGWLDEKKSDWFNALMGGCVDGMAGWLAGCVCVCICLAARLTGWLADCYSLLLPPLAPEFCEVKLQLLSLFLSNRHHAVHSCKCGSDLHILFDKLSLFHFAATITKVHLQPHPVAEN